MCICACVGTCTCTCGGAGVCAYVSDILRCILLSFGEVCKSMLATSVDVTHVTSRFYKLPPFNVWWSVAHTYLFPSFSGPGVKGIAKTTNPSIAQDRWRAGLHGVMSFVFLRHRKVELRPKANFWSHFLAVSCHRALLKRRYLDSATSNLE